MGADENWRGQVKNRLRKGCTRERLPDSWLEEFFREHGMTYETGCPENIDRYGGRYMALCADSQESAKAALDAYKERLLGCLWGATHVVWRIEPEMAIRKEGRKYIFSVYSRLTYYNQRPDVGAATP